MFDVLRALTFVLMVVIFFSWAVIMSRSLIAYVRARRAGQKASLRLHIWTVTVSFLMLLVGAGWDLVENLGEPVETDDLVLTFPATILGAIAVIMFLKQGRTTVRVGERTPPETGPTGALIAAAVVTGLAAVVGVVVAVAER